MHAFYGRAISLLAVMTVSSTALANFTAEEQDNFTLIYGDSNLVGFGAPSVDGNTVEYFPEGMGVSTTMPYDADEKITATKYWSTSITVLPSDGIDFTSLSFMEQGEFGSNNSDNEYNIEARLFISSLSNPDDWQFLGLGENFESNSSGDWEISGSTDLGDYSDGFVLNIQNILTICSYPMDVIQPIPSMFGTDGFTPPTLNLDENFLSKNYIGIEIETAVIPLPASFWMFSSALGLMFSLVRKDAS